MGIEKKLNAPSKKVIFVAFSDIQIEDWKRYSKDHSRLFINGAIIKQVLRLCKKYKVPALFGGDLFDNPKYLTNLVLQETVKWLNWFNNRKIPIISIPGNHDQSEANTLDHTSPNYIRTLSKIYPLITDLSFKIHDAGNYLIAGIPFISGNVGFKSALEKISKKVTAFPDKKKILLIHSDLPGAIDTTGREVGTAYDIPIHLNKFFSKFDLVLCGHIHKPQILRKKIIIMGATHQQRTTDSGVSMGCWLIFEDLSYKFIKIKAPEFKFLKPGVSKPEDDNFYIESPKVDTEDQDDIEVKSFVTANPKKLTKAYLKIKGIKSKSKTQLLIKYLSNE
jgi:DNA repair exonuclease SbcCD nuclease subunit